jgi:hypothetical protein
MDTRCVCSQTGQRVTFGDAGRWKAGHTLPACKDVDGMAHEFSDRSKVETVSLTGPSTHGQAPADLDLTSNDTEGSEFGILGTFDCARFRFGMMVAEHNNLLGTREALLDLKEGNVSRRLPLHDRITTSDDCSGDAGLCGSVPRTGMGTARLDE